MREGVRNARGCFLLSGWNPHAGAGSFLICLYADASCDVHAYEFLRVEALT